MARVKDCARWTVGCGLTSASEKSPDFEKSGGEVGGSFRDPAVDEVWGKECGALDFRWREDEGAIVLRGEDLDKLLSGIFARGDFSQTGEGGRDAEFFFGFSKGGGGVGFAGFEVAGGAGVPFGGLAIFPRGTFLQEQVAGLVEDKNVHGAVEQAGGVDVTARVAGDDGVVFIDDIEVLVSGLGGHGGGGVEGAGQIDPIGDGEIFRAGGGGKLAGGAPC